MQHSEMKPEHGGSTGMGRKSADLSLHGARFMIIFPKKGKVKISKERPMELLLNN